VSSPRLDRGSIPRRSAPAPLAARRSATDPDGAQVAAAAAHLGELLVEQERCREARLRLAEAEAIYRDATSPDPGPLREVEALLARCPVPSAGF
jgi:hypothetical protein